MPSLLALLDASQVAGPDAKPWYELWSALAHQGDVYSASFAAVPHVVAALERSPGTFDSNYFHFPAWVEVCRAKSEMRVPAELADAYRHALAQFPRLASHALTPRVDDSFLQCVLAAIAASQGRTSLAELLLELDPDEVESFLER